MPIVSNAAPDELNSPFYKKNEDLCNQWEKYILGKEGEVNGVYNSMSFVIKAKVTSYKTWDIDIEKDTIGDGHYWLTSKHRGNKETAIYQTILSTACSNFKIQKSGIRVRGKKHQLAQAIYDLVKPAIENDSLHEVRFKKQKLSIVLYRKNDWFEFTERLLAFEETE